MVTIHPTPVSITDISGIQVGQAQDHDALTGCTVILCKNGAVGGVDQRGGAPGTRETDALHPMHLVEKIHAVVLAGGSAFGLDASSGVMRWLEEQGVGFETGVARVPIVASAVLFDLAVGKTNVRPDAAMGYQACLNASSRPPLSGNYGAGTGATVGKILGMQSAMKSGIGTASVLLSGGIIVSALVAVNPLGDVVDPNTRKILAGARIPGVEPITFADTLKILETFPSGQAHSLGSNTVIGAVVTNALLTKEQANKVAQMAHNGLALTIRPAHTMLDGDTIFCMATGEIPADVSTIGAYAAEVVASAIINAVMSAEAIPGIPSVRSLSR